MPPLTPDGRPDFTDRPQSTCGVPIPEVTARVAFGVENGPPNTSSTAILEQVTANRHTTNGSDLLHTGLEPTFTRQCGQRAGRDHRDAYRRRSRRSQLRRSIRVMTPRKASLSTTIAVRSRRKMVISVSMSAVASTVSGLTDIADAT